MSFRADVRILGRDDNMKMEITMGAVSEAIEKGVK